MSMRFLPLLLVLSLGPSVLPPMASAQDEPLPGLRRLDLEGIYLTGSVVGQLSSSERWYWGGEAGLGYGAFVGPVDDSNNNGRIVHLGFLFTRAFSRA